MIKTVIQQRLVFHQAALEKLQAAYLALVEGLVQSFNKAYLEINT